MPKANPETRVVRGWTFLVIAILFEVAGSLSLKGALEEPWLYVVVVIGYGIAFTSLAQVLRAGLSLGVAYGIWGACGVALTAVMSMLIFGEPLTPVMIAGIMVIIAGVLCIELGAQAANRRATATAQAGAA